MGLCERVLGLTERLGDPGGVFEGLWEELGRKTSRSIE